jgi:hypothetical protein
MSFRITPRARAVATALFIAPFAGLAFGGDVKVIFTEIVTDPSGTVPGALDSASMPVATNWLAIEDMSLRSDGGQWCIKGRTTQATTNDSILVLGSNLTGTMFCQDGQPFQGGVAGELYDFFDSGSPISWNANGDIGFSCRAKGGVAAVFEKVVRVVGGVHTIVHQMGDSFPGLTDVVANPTGDELFGNSIGSVTLLDDGSFLFGNTPITNCHSSRYPAVFRSTTAFLQSGVTPITSLLGANEIWDNFLFDGGGGTSDGLNWFWEGDTENATTTIDAIFAVNGVCIFQEGQPLPGSSMIYTDTFQARMADNGDWIARGDDPSDNDWVVRNSVLLAKTGDPIITGATENWGVSFSAIALNAVGDWILVGNTSSTDPNKDTVMVLNGIKVLAREGDPIDLNGNGQFDDDVFIASFQANDVNLADNGGVWFLATLRNGAATLLGDAFLQFRTCGESTAYGTGCPGSGGFTPTLSLDGCFRAGGTATLDIQAGLGGATALILFGASPVSLAMPGPCTLLVAPLPSVLSLTLGGSGAGQGSLSVPSALPADLGRVTFYMQAFTQDNGVFQGYANSNGLEIEFD